MDFNRRKLLYESPDPDIEDICPKFCSFVDDDGYCSISCSCPQICYRPLNPPPPIKSHNFSFPLTLSLIILSIAFFLFCCYTLFRYCTFRYASRRRSRSPASLVQDTRDDFLSEDRGPTMVDHPIWYIRTVGLQQSLIDSITVCKYRRDDGLVEGTECSVCLSEFREGETLRLLPKCNHAFHLPCIDTWLSSHTNCPLCRAGIFPVGSPAPELSVENLGDLEEAQMGELENSDDLGVEREEEGEIENGLKRIGSDFEPIRRSVSVNSLSMSQSDEISNTQLAKVNESNVGIVPKRVRLVGSSSIKRSLSCSGKILMSRYSRSRNSVLPL